MLQTVECTTRAQMRAFLRCGKRENAFTPDRIACDPSKNVLLRTCRHAFLLALADERPVARCLLLDGGEKAWFSLLQMRGSEDGRALFDTAEKIARNWGAQELKGPVSPDGSGFDLGMRMPGTQKSAAPWHPDTPESWPNIMTECGFVASETLAELTIPLENRQNPYRGAGEWAQKSRNMTLEAFSLRDRRGCEVAFAASEDAQARGYDAFARIYGRCGELAGNGRALAAFSKGRPAGWLMLAPEIKRGAMRILHIQVLPTYRRGPCAAMLLEAAWDRAAEQGAKEICASTIDLKNDASLRMASNAGGRISGVYGVFLRKSGA